ncbi:MAG: hypothetical protein D6791_06565 [Chloroflexi bacterium]|nr:MAG: hypothetical protein D6791_06565 [Chloroflexota bacterium]
MMHTPKLSFIGTRVLLASVVLLSAFYLAPRTVSADPPTPASPGDEVCTVCHWLETSQWRSSPHAANEVLCESCHGEYVQGHPDEDVMMLSVDPVLCSECHETNYAAWEQSLHAREDVSCISCHVPHSQTTRLNSQRLCLTCHDDDVGVTWQRTGHAAAGVTCVDCHLSQPVGAGQQGEEGSNHVFTMVPSQLCINCHAANLHEPVTVNSGKSAMTGGTLASYSSDMQNLPQRLETLQTQNRSLQTWVLIMLGLGLGLGLATGIVLMILYAYACQKKEAAS